MNTPKVEIHQLEESPSTPVFVILFTALASFVLGAYIQGQRLDRRLVEVEAREAAVQVQLDEIEETLHGYAAAINAHQEYIEAKQKGFASAWHYARHEGWRAEVEEE